MLGFLLLKYEIFAWPRIGEKCSPRSEGPTFYAARVMLRRRSRRRRLSSMSSLRGRRQRIAYCWPHSMYFHLWDSSTVSTLSSNLCQSSKAVVMEFSISQQSNELLKELQQLFTTSERNSLIASSSRWKYRSSLLSLTSTAKQKYARLRTSSETRQDRV